MQCFQDCLRSFSLILLMAIISLPTAPDFRTSRFALVTNTQRFISPLNGAVQTRELPGARWSLSVTLPPMHTQDGTGIGLPIVRDIMASHGGQLEIESSPGEGTLVTLRWPKPDAEQNAA